MTDLRETSTKAYDYCSKMLEERYGSLDKPESVISKINSSTLADNSKKFYFVCAFKKTGKEEYMKEAVALKQKLSAKALEQKLTDKEKKNYLDYDQIQKACADCLASEKESLETKILMALYCKLPPVRLDYAKLRIVSKEPKDKGNYLVLTAKNAKIVINDHKTAKSHGTLIREIPEDIFKMIKEWRKTHKDEFIFNYSRNYLSTKMKNLFKKYTGVPASVNTIRHAFVSNQTKGERPLKDKLSDAEALGHSVSQQALYRRLETS